MSKIEDFENAPVGATATHKLSGSRAMKVNDGDQYWITQWGSDLSDGQMGLCDYTLDQPAPESAREALDLAWELAHEVKEGQVIPVGAWLVDRRYNKTLVEKNTFFDITVDEWGAENIRTLEPLPEPEPDWLDAPAVIAHVDAPNVQPTSVFVPTGTHPDRWGRFDSEWTFHWNELRDVIPLYPGEGQNPWSD